MKNICEWKNCRETGEFKAPAEKDNSKNFKLLCKEHIGVPKPLAGESLAHSFPAIFSIPSN